MKVSCWGNKEENEVTKVVAQSWQILKRFLIDVARCTDRKMMKCYAGQFKGQSQVFKDNVSSYLPSLVVRKNRKD
jgi:hypothetical protein